MPKLIMVWRASRLSKRIRIWPSACSKRRSNPSQSRRGRPGRWCTWRGSRTRRATANRPPGVIGTHWQWKAHLRRLVKPRSRASSEVLRRSQIRGVYMKRIILSGALALAVALPGLLAQPKPKSAVELEALKTMFGAQDADPRIAACENVLTKFADTEFKAVALYFEAASYEQKGDFEHTVVFAERTIEADPKHFQAMLMLAALIAQHTKEFDLDREEKLAQVEKYAKTALDLLKDAPKPNPNITDDQWAAAKKDFAAEAHAALGMGAMARKKFDVAESEFTVAPDGADKPDPATLVRLGK